MCLLFICLFVIFCLLYTESTVYVSTLFLSLYFYFFALSSKVESVTLHGAIGILFPHFLILHTNFFVHSFHFAFLHSIPFNFMSHANVFECVFSIGNWITSKWPYDFNDFSNDLLRSGSRSRSLLKRKRINHSKQNKREWEGKWDDLTRTMSWNKTFEQRKKNAISVYI